MRALGLSERIGAGTVACEARDVDRYGRLVAFCRAGGEDLSAWLVGRGLAVAYRHYSEAYVADEDRARVARAGLWSGTFTEPWVWRAQARSAGR